MKNMSVKKITEFEIVNKVMLFDAEVYRVLGNAPKKWRFNKVQQIQNALGEAEMLLIDSIDTAPTTQELFEEKIFLLSRSRSRLRFGEVQLYRLNDDGSISSNTIARIMVLMYDLYKNYDRLLSSLRKKYGSDVSDRGHYAEPSVIRTADCGAEGGSGA